MVLAALRGRVGVELHLWNQPEPRNLCAAARPGTDRTGCLPESAACGPYTLQHLHFTSSFPPLCVCVWVVRRLLLADEELLTRRVWFSRLGSCESLMPVERTQDARQRRRLAEARRLRPGVHRRLPARRLDLPLLRLHVSSPRGTKVSDVTERVIHPFHPSMCF